MIAYVNCIYVVLRSNRIAVNCVAFEVIIIIISLKAKQYKCHLGCMHTTAVAMVCYGYK